MEIKVLGTGCTKCNALEKTARQAVEDLGLSASVIKEEDIMKIMGYGVMRTPGLVVNEKVIVSGRVPSQKELKEMLTQIA